MAMAMYSGDSLRADDVLCPICLEMFTSPRQLPCMHAFCEKCLQNHISTNVYRVGTVKIFVCPVCRALTNQPKTEKPVEEWASFFPRSAITVVTELTENIELSCDACRFDGESNKADGFCVVCEEAFCSTCLKVHQKTTSTRNHTIISIDELTSSKENRLRFAEGFGCLDHQEKRIEYYCQIHDAICCADCFFVNHRSCDDVKKLNSDLSSFMTELKPEEIINKMKKLEKHLQNFVKLNESNIYDLEATINNLKASILDIRQKINSKLDELEALVKREGTKIYIEEMTKRQEENHQCQCLINAVRNSHTFLETVLKFGTDTQKFLVCKKSFAQFKSYADHIREKYENIETVKIDTELEESTQYILMQYFNSVGKLEFKTERSNFLCSVITDSSFCPSISKSKELKLKLDRVVEIHISREKKPFYTGIVHLPDDSIVLADYVNKACSVYDSSYHLVSSWTLPAKPFDMCLVNQHEVAVTLRDKKTVQFLSIRDGCIKDSGTFTTRYQCYGLASFSRNEFVVSGYTDDLTKCCWSIAKRSTEETSYHVFDCLNPIRVRITLNNARTRLYICIYDTNEVFCFDIRNGKQYFIYTSKDLKNPYGILVDRKDIIYVVGNGSHNIHILSPNGRALQIITVGIPKYPGRIIFDRSQSYFVLTNFSDMERSHLHIFNKE